MACLTHADNRLDTIVPRTLDISCGRSCTATLLLLTWAASRLAVRVTSAWSFPFKSFPLMFLVLCFSQHCVTKVKGWISQMAAVDLKWMLD